MLDNDDDGKALALIRLSSRQKSNVVSWNHMMNWHMKKGKTRAALEVYNEMKKRGIKPDSHTYLLLLRGLADHADHPHSLGRALSLYHSMSAPGNQAAPTIMHTNCVLKVCARANDADSMWDIASRLPERGPHAADQTTFTTIFNNLRQNAITGGIAGEETMEQTARRREASVVQGRRLWEMIIQRWRAGDVRIDEELTCSMGRLLLIGGRPQDWDDVLSLLHQTMDIPRLIPRLGTAARQQLSIPRVRAPNTPSDMKILGFETSPADGDELARQDSSRTGGTTEQKSPEDIFALTNLQRPSDPAQFTAKALNKAKHTHVFARPRNSTLSLVLEACLKMAAKTPANEYWSLLTNPTGRFTIVPDLDNMHMWLRILRQSHSSAEAATVIREHLAAAKLKPFKKTFAIAMAACARDSRNPNAVEHASRVLDQAMAQLAEPGANTLRLFLDCVEARANVVEHAYAASISTANTDRTMLSDEPLKGLREAVHIQVSALSRLEPGAVALKSLLSFGENPKDRPGSRSRIEWAAEVKREKTDALNLLRRMVALYDRVITLCQGRERQLGLEVGDRAKLVERKAKLSAFLTRQHEKSKRLTLAERGWRGVGRSEGQEGWRVGSTGGNANTPIQRPRRLEEAATTL